IFIYLFCLFPFCVITEEPTILVDSFRSGAIDPYKGEITPLFLEGSPATLTKFPPAFPAPEFELARALKSLELGAKSQAGLVAKNAITFMQRVIAGEPGIPHICYKWKRPKPHDDKHHEPRRARALRIA